VVIIAHLGELDRINRESGFAAGDAAIQKAAEAFHRAAARINGTAFRVSGSRIGLLARDVDQATGEQLAASIRDDASGSVTAIGVAAWQPGQSAEQIIERAMRAACPPQSPLASPLRPQGSA
jgi:GGDEF domain-containing protein